MREEEARRGQERPGGARRGEESWERLNGDSPLENHSGFRRARGKERIGMVARMLLLLRLLMTVQKTL